MRVGLGPEVGRSDAGTWLRREHRERCLQGELVPWGVDRGCLRSLPVGSSVNAMERGEMARDIDGMRKGRDAVLVVVA